MPEPKKLIIIIEDDPGTSKYIQRVLEEAGYATMHAKNGFEGGRLVGSFKPALVTLDINMPEMGGEMVLVFLKSVVALQDIKVLLISGLAEDALKKAAAKGASDYILKPFERKELLDKVHRLIG